MINTIKHTERLRRIEPIDDKSCSFAECSFSYNAKNAELN